LVTQGFLAFIQQQFGSLEVYEVRVPSAGLDCFNATLDLRGTKTVEEVLQRELVFENGSRERLSEAVGKYSQVRYWAALAEVYM
jgi:hypothetical protein